MELYNPDTGMTYFRCVECQRQCRTDDDDPSLPKVCDRCIGKFCQGRECLWQFPSLRRLKPGQELCETCQADEAMRCLEAREEPVIGDDEIPF